MPGVKHLRSIQLGKEATAGTPVAATAIWRGMGVMEDTRETVYPEEDVGYLGGVDRAYVPKLGAQIEFEETPATYQQLGYILSAGVAADTAGSADGAGSDYIYTHAIPTTAQPTIKTYTIEAGDDQQFEEMEYGFVSEFNLSGNAGEAVMVSATWMGRQASNVSKTGAISLPAVEEILFQKGKLYIDAIDGTAGSTQITGSLLGFNLTYTTGLMAYYTADGNLYFTAHKNVGPEIVCELTFEHNAAAVTQKNSIYRAGTSRLIRLLFEGSAFATGGTTYANHTLIIDLVGQWESFAALDEQDGNDILTGTFRNRYNSTAATAGQFIVVNELSALT